MHCGEVRLSSVSSLELDAAEVVREVDHAVAVVVDAVRALGGRLIVAGVAAVTTTDGSRDQERDKDEAHGMRL